MNQKKRKKQDKPKYVFVNCLGLHNVNRSIVDYEHVGYEFLTLTQQGFVTPPRNLVIPGVDKSMMQAQPAFVVVFKLTDEYNEHPLPTGARPTGLGEGVKA